MNFEAFNTHQNFTNTTEDLFLPESQAYFQGSSSFDFPEISLFDEDNEITLGEPELDFTAHEKVLPGEELGQTGQDELKLFDTDFATTEMKLEKGAKLDLALTTADSKSQSAASRKRSSSNSVEGVPQENSKLRRSSEDSEDSFFNNLDLDDDSIDQASSHDSELPAIRSKAIKKTKKAKKSVKKSSKLTAAAKKFRYRTHKKQFKFVARGHKLDTKAETSGTKRLSNFPVSYEIKYQTKLGPQVVSEEDDYELDCEDWSETSSTLSTGSLLNLAQEEPPKGISYDSLVQALGRSRGMNHGGAEAAFHTFKSINGLQDGVDAYQLELE